MNGDENQGTDDLRSMLADYLGDELDPRKRAEFEREMQGDPELATEVASLQSALHALRSLDEGDETVRAGQGHEQVATTTIRGASALRYAAMIGLAFVVGYALRGMVAQPTPLPIERSEAGKQVDVPSDSFEDFGTRLARNYLDQPGRSGFGRSLIAYARTAQRTKKNN